MLKDIRYSVEFPTTGLKLSGDYSLPPGVTAVSGRNGTGKTFGTIELIRYGLFGKRALRGPASDYKSLDMELAFEVLGTEYFVRRNRKKEELFKGSEVIAVGADAVNKEIVGILGFGLEVFDVVCAARQKDSEALQNLTPANRKRLIDEVLGLNRQEAAEKACRDEANGLRRSAEALERVLVEPEAPEKPEGYLPAEELAELVAQEQRRLALKRAASEAGLAPARPEREAGDVEALEEHERERARVEARRSTLEAIPDPEWTEEELEAAEALLEWQLEIDRRGPKPEWELVDLERWDCAVVDATCPKCSHKFRTGEDSPLSPAEIREQIARHNRWPDNPPRPEGLELTASEIRRGRLALDRASEKAELSTLVVPEDRSEELAEERRLSALWAAYHADEERWKEQKAKADAAEKELSELPPEPTGGLEQLQKMQVLSAAYDARVEEYDKAVGRYETQKKELAALTQSAVDYAAGGKALAEARRRLKSHLAPTLSRISSHILREMTSRAERPLHEVSIDENMEISVDGQDIATLSGAQATIANLAIRIALGRALVSRVFPVFIGDEIDADADEANAQAIADALSNLRSQVKQVIVISHKELEGADHQIAFG